MKTAPANLVAFLNGISGDAKCWRADLFTITLKSGTIYRWTSADFNVSYLGNTFLSAGGGSAPLIKRGSLRQSCQLSVDTLDLTISGYYLIASKPLVQRAAEGFFDGARVKIDHMIGAYPGDVSLGAIDSWFEGPVSAVQPHGVTVNLRLKSQLELLNIELPRFQIQPQCNNAVYDPNCGLVKATWTIAATASAGTIATVTTATAGMLSKADNYFNLGVVSFLGDVTPALAGIKRGVSDWVQSTGVLTLALVLPVAPAAGDSFTAYPGCDRDYTTCNSRYSNTASFRGFRYVPRPEAGS